SGNGSKVEVVNSGGLRTMGGDSFGILAQSIGGGGGLSELQLVDPEAPPPGSGGACGAVFCLGGSGGAQGNGGEVVVDNDGWLWTSGKGARAVYAQSIGGGGGAVAGGTKTTFGLTLLPRGIAYGGIGGSGGSGGSVTATNVGDVITEGDSAEAIFAQSIGGG